MSQPTRSHETVARLKELLFDQESRELDTLADRIAELQKRAGSDEQFQRSVAKVLEGALEEVEADRKSNVDVSEAMAPMVLRTFRKEMASETTKAQIADIMYPSMGQMVRRYVASAIQDMMEEINRRLDAKFSKNPFMLALRSIFSRQSLAQQAMAEAQRLDVVEIYLVRRGSGELIHHWEQPEPGVAPGTDVGDRAGDNRDALISGFLSAITSFAEEAFEADKESLRTLNFDGYNIVFRSSPDRLLAAKCRGTTPDGHEQLLDQELLHVLAEHQAIESQAASAPAEADAVSETRAYDTLLGGFAKRLDDRVRDWERERSKARAIRTFKIVLVARIF